MIKSLTTACSGIILSVQMRKLEWRRLSNISQNKWILTIRSKRKVITETLDMVWAWHPGNMVFFCSPACARCTSRATWRPYRVCRTRSWPSCRARRRWGRAGGQSRTSPSASPSCCSRWTEPKRESPLQICTTFYKN